MLHVGVQIRILTLDAEQNFEVILKGKILRA